MGTGYLEFQIDFIDVVQTITEQKPEQIAELLLIIFDNLKKEKLEQTLDSMKEQLWNDLQVKLSPKLILGENK